jgi:acetolactate synthase-1/3 small subunit
MRIMFARDVRDFDETTCRPDQMASTLSVLVENKPGVLARVADSSRAGSTSTRGGRPSKESPDHHRRQRRIPTEQVTKQLNKLINVLKIVELAPESSVQRELMLIKVRADLATRSAVLETVQLFRAKVIDVAPEAVTIEATGTLEIKASATLTVRGALVNIN